MKHPLFPLSLAALLLSQAPVAAQSLLSGRDDPRGLIPAQPAPQLPGQTACGDVPARALTLADLADIALCRNPQTTSAWAGARIAAAQSGAARGRLLPSVDVQIGPTFSRSDSFLNTGFVDSNGQVISGASTVCNATTTARLAVNYLIFDGGARRAGI
ncbi:TolC family protein, partial [Sandarakinorhabdus sp.]|uniref:TolC family protein n=1 Tax=Sandarakinorhabdus sp. TaxID=1916663 RepID=UPI00286DFBC6